MFHQIDNGQGDRPGPEPRTLSKVIDRVRRNLRRMQKLLENERCGSPQRRLEKAMVILQNLEQDAHIITILHAREQQIRTR